MENFNDTMTAGNVKAAMKEVGAVSADLWQVTPDKLRVLEGFNARVKNDTYTGRVRFLTIRGVNMTERGTVEGVHADRLAAVFTEQTGFDTHM